MVLGRYDVYKQRLPTAVSTENMTLIQQQQQQKTIVTQVSGHRPLAPAPSLTDIGSRLPYLINNNDSGSNNNNNNNNIKKKSSLLFNPSGATQIAPHQSTSVQRRNARERNRVKQVNNGFATLRSKIPVSLDSSSRATSSSSSSSSSTSSSSTSPTHTGGQRSTSKKLSKVETLRLAVEYIKRLEQLIEESYKDELNGKFGDEYYDSSSSPPAITTTAAVTTTTTATTNYPNLNSISSTTSSSASQTFSPPISPPSSPPNSNYNNSNYIEQTFMPIKLTEIYENTMETINNTPNYENYENYENYPEDTLLRHIIRWENEN